MQETFSFQELPQNAEAIASLMKENPTNPFYIAALSIASFARYMESAEDGIAMLNVLKGPEPLSAHQQQFLRDRKMEGYAHVPRSYFEGATPENDYTPAKPYTITVSDNPYSYPSGEMVIARLLLKSGGADTERFLSLRQKPSSGEWFLWSDGWMGVLSGIRPPKSQDAWA